MALVAVLLALTLLSVLASAAYFVAVQEGRSGRSAISVPQALAVAEGAADSIAANWNALAYESLRPGDSDVVQLSAPTGAAWSRGVVTRLGSVTFLIRVESVKGAARQAAGLVVRLRCDTSCSATNTYVDSARPARLPERGWVPGF